MNNINNQNGISNNNMMNSNNPQMNIFQSYQNPNFPNNNYPQNMKQNFKNLDLHTDNTNRNYNNNFQDNRMNYITDIKIKNNNNNNIFQNNINNGNHNNNNYRNDNYAHGNNSKYKNFNNHGNYQFQKNNGNYNEKNEQNKFNNYPDNYPFDKKNYKNLDNNEPNPRYENIPNKINNDKQKQNKFIIKKHEPNLQYSIICRIIKTAEAIDSNETNVIKSIVQLLYSTYSNNNKKTLSTIISENIKNKLGEEWFVFISKKNSKISLSFTTVSESDFLVIDIGQSLLKIAKTK